MNALHMDYWHLNSRKIKERLAALNLTQEMLAKKTSLSESWLQKCLAGRPLKQSHCESIALVLDIADWRQIVTHKAPPRTKPAGTSTAKRYDDLHDARKEIRAELLREGEPQTLYAAISDGSFLAPFLSDVDSPVPWADSSLTRANIDRIEVRIMTSEVMNSLHERGLLEEHLPHDLEKNLRILRNLHRVPPATKSRDGRLSEKPIKVAVDTKYWTGLPLMWGFLVGDLLVYGRWKPDSRGRYVAGNTTYVARRDGAGDADFSYWSRVLLNGSPDSVTDAPNTDTPAVVVVKPSGSGRGVPGPKPVIKPQRSNDASAHSGSADPSTSKHQRRKKK